ncbi:ribonuclease P protein component [Candidatus Saccharibacteria bacterium]|nr:ribonuclease P protein component [Candidatus Saccharibacteria bacterium]
MLARNQRLRDSGSIQRTLRKSKKVDIVWANIYISKTKIRNTRGAVIVSKKVSKKAIIRNRIRRKIYEQIRQTIREQPLSCDIVLVVKQEISQLDSKIIGRDLIGGLGKGLDFNVDGGQVDINK